MLLFALAEARWGSVLFRFLATVLMCFSISAFTVALGPAAWRAFGRAMTRLLEGRQMALESYSASIQTHLVTRTH